MINKWIAHESDKGEGKTLFCFPHAGGTAAFFAEWGGHIEGTAVLPVQFPMREKRIREPMPDSIRELVKGFVDDCIDILRERPFAFLGHCSGSIVAYEAAVYLKEKYDIVPKILFASSCYSPMDYSAPILSSLSNDELLKTIKEAGFVSEELMADPVMLEYFTPIVRKDFYLQENYKSNSVVKLDCPIAVMYGKKDGELSNKQGLDNWENYTSSNFSTDSFDASHFYLKDRSDEVISRITEIMKEYIKNE